MDSVELRKELPCRTLFRAIENEEGLVWLDRATGGPSFMAFDPVSQLRVGADGRVLLACGAEETPLPSAPPDAIAEFVRRGTSPDHPTDLPHTFGYVGYDLAAAVESHTAVRADPAASLPRAHLARYEVVLRCDPLFPRVENSPCRITAFGRDRRKLAETVAAIERQLDDPDLARPVAEAPTGASRLVERPEQARYLRSVERALDYIAAGDIYQINLAARFVAETALPAGDAYLRLREAQPVPFGVFFDGAGQTLLSNSPERFLQVDGDAVSTEPIKGTRPRAADADRDHALAQELRTDPKERAENVMIVDLERSDLGRICARGSVHVPSLLRVETWSTLHHLVSTVAGRLRPDASLASILRATFPGGSITGAPKIRATHLIAELEDQAREIYTGSFFAFAGPRHFDSSILIRSAVLRGRKMQYHAGCGIVADSDPAREFRELELKALPFLRALGIVEKDADAAPARDKTR